MLRRNSAKWLADGSLLLDSLLIPVKSLLSVSKKIIIRAWRSDTPTHRIKGREGACVCVCVSGGGGSG